MEERREDRRAAEQPPLFLTPLGALSAVSGLESVRDRQDWSQPYILNGLKRSHGPPVLEVGGRAGTGFILV